ncbi:GAF domain-containing protein [Prevotella sp. A2931]|uniref:GAF domain-containing protein n=1 Tax=Prevotella illustrans TaxID=2800387 RepID=A0ABS3M4V0_9BACT|nr:MULTISPECIES: GAF domain-containing protein [Prevotella]MBO1363204.1 GAF domain-containing protein [Prevotella illustrans]PTL25328.1 GAF domain-containing protein [Prevotella sp. oral taxon 820]
MNHTDKTALYNTLIEQIRSLVAGEHNMIGVLANVSAAMKQTFPNQYFWVGFYLVRNDELQLGPFQGTVACMRIAKGRGVCGTAWKENRTLIVSDVEQFADHIACSSLSRSEIVVPIREKGSARVLGVIDIDSTSLHTFDEKDAEKLEEIAKILAEILENQRIISNFV